MTANRRAWRLFWRVILALGAPHATAVPRLYKACSASSVSSTDLGGAK